jgi:FlaA1/EpsC-like NDP-sugar epimerase
VGTGDSAQLLALRLRRNTPQSRPYQIVGFIDDDSDKRNLLVEGVRVMGTCHDIGRLVQEFKIDVIAIAMGQMSAAEFREVLKYCEHTSARIKVIPDVLDLMQTQHSAPTLLRDVELEDLIGRGQVSQHESVNLEMLRRKVVLVTGAAGSIGSELSRQIVRYDPTCLLLLDNNESGLYDLEMELKVRAPLLKLIPVLADVTQRDQLEAVFKKHQPQLIFHAAAYKHVPMLEEYPAQALAVNIGGTLHLALLAAEHKAERFILISTDKAIRPSSVMGASKRVCEELLHALADETYLYTRYASVRFGNVLGSRGSVVPLFTRQIEQGGPVTVTHPDMTRYFLTIPEAVNLVIHAACLMDGGDTFLLKMGERVRILDLAERMIRLRGLRPGIDMAIKITGIRPGEKLHEELFDSEEHVTETVHPYIVKVTSRCHDWDAQSLLDELQRLLHDSPKTAASALDALLQILAHKPDVSYRNGHVLQPADKPE